MMASGGGASGAAGAAGISGAACPIETSAAAPTLSTDCETPARAVDPIFTCGRADCAVTKALDLACGTLPVKPWISATADGAVLMAKTVAGPGSAALVRLMTVAAMENRVEDPSLSDPKTLSFVTLGSQMTTSASGATWLVDRSAPSLTVVHETDAGWVRARSDSPYDGELGSVSLVGDELRYLTYATEDGHVPHLLTRAGSCLTDQVLGAPNTFSTVVKTDGAGQPWVTWLTNPAALYLRSPGGDVEDLSALVGALDSSRSPRLRLLPGGLDGTAAFPIVALNVANGIAVLSRNEAEPVWQSVVLPFATDTFAPVAGCPTEASYDCSDDPCAGMTTCAAQRSGASSGFDLVRTQSGATFVAWVEFAAEGTYALQKALTSGELPGCFCGWSETSGTGTAELVVARLGGSAPVLGRFRFDMRGAILSLDRDVVMAARGDTLVIAGQLSGDNVPALTYLEVDTALLP
ncbi:MAG TPA: hypothetical protein VGP07_20610 [Polyangia bacterium]